MPFTSISAGWIFTLMGLLDDGRPLNQGKSQTIYPLGHQIPHAVFDALGVAVIGEASGQAIQQADTLIHLAQPLPAMESEAKAGRPQ